MIILATKIITLAIIRLMPKVIVAIKLPLNDNLNDHHNSDISSNTHNSKRNKKNKY